MAVVADLFGAGDADELCCCCFNVLLAAALAAASEAHIVKQFSLPRNLSNSLSGLHIEKHCPSAYMFVADLPAVFF